MEKEGQWSRSRVGRNATILASAISAVVFSGKAAAFAVDTDNPDISIRWDNTVRYNIGFRAEDCDKNICGNGKGAGDITAHQSDRKFSDAGDIVTNRLDLLTELDVVYKNMVGFRISAAGWYDNAYDDTSVKGDSALEAAGFDSSRNGNYTGSIKRWNRGPSGEILDAFVFTQFDVDGMPVNLKLGKHNVYWGESLFSFVGGVAYGQGPVDIRKSLANPGSEAKELFKPLNQFSFTMSLTDRLAITGQYFFDWKASPLPDGGTYFGPADFFTGGGGTVVPMLGVPAVFDGTRDPKDKSGDWGVAVRWRPEWLDGRLGFYYREYTDKLPQMVIGGVTPGGALRVDLDYRTPRQKLYGISLGKQIGSISFGADVTYRKDAQIAVTPFANVIAANAADLQWRPTGDVWTALANIVAYYGETPLFDSAALTAELNYSKLERITHDPLNLFYGRNENCAGGEATKHGCPTRDAFGVAVAFEPKWFQVRPGMDLSMPLFLSLGLRGNSPVPFGDNEGQGSYSIGLAADIENRYNFAIKFNGFLAKHSNDGAGVLSNSNSSLGKYWDRNWVSITFKTTF